jgi:nitric oxide reductase large subunit
VKTILILAGIALVLLVYQLFIKKDKDEEIAKRGRLRKQKPL